MYNYKNCKSTESNTVNACPSGINALKYIEESNQMLYTLWDLEKIFQVSRRTLFNWRSKGVLPMFDMQGRAYISHEKLKMWINKMEGVTV